MIPYLTYGYHDSWTCALCRMKRTEYVYLGRNWGTEYTETECTPWYREHVESAHDHVWVRARDTAIRNLYGHPVGGGSRDPRGGAIWSLSPADQVAVYEHFPTTSEGKQLFLTLAQRTSGHDDYAIIRRLQAWKEAGFKGSWQDAAQR